MIRFRSPVLAAVLATGSLGGCASLDIPGAANPAIETELSAIDAPASWVFGPGTDDEIAVSWATVLADPTLTSLIAEALENNPSLRASGESVARAEALLAQSRAGLLPSLGASAGANGGGDVDDSNFNDSYSASLSASWEADLWGAIKGGVLGSTYDLGGTKAVFRSSREALIASVARAYILMIEARKYEALTKATLDAQLETKRIVDVRYDLGAASRGDVVLAQSDVASAQDNLVSARASETIAILALQSLLGRYPDGTFTVPAEFPAIRSAPTVGNPADFIRRRPDIQAAEFNVLGAFVATRIAETSRWPSLTLSAGLSDAASNPANLLNASSLAYSLGSRLAASIFDGGLTDARIDAATASQRQALAQYGQTVLAGYLDVETALLNIDTLEDRLVYVQQGAEASRETIRLAEIQYKEGAIDLLDMLTFRQRSFQTDRTLIAIERQIIEARIALYLALGGASTTRELVSE